MLLRAALDVYDMPLWRVYVKQGGGEQGGGSASALGDVLRFCSRLVRFYFFLHRVVDHPLLLTVNAFLCCRRRQDQKSGRGMLAVLPAKKMF